MFRVPAWLWPNVLSLDAPAVAVLWQVLLARGLDIQPGRYEPAVLAASIWLVYVADRVLDSLKRPEESWEPPRKRFYRTHFRAAALLAGCGALVIVPSAFLLLRPQALRAGLVLSLLLAIYFACVHFAPRRWTRFWPRQFTVAMFFTAGPFLALFAAANRQRVRIAAPSAIFLLLCWINIALIEFMEAPARRSLDPSTRWMGRRAGVAALAAGVLALVAGILSWMPGSIVAAALLSALALNVVAKRAGSMTPEFLPVAADLALCTPLLVFPFIWTR